MPVSLAIKRTLYNYRNFWYHTFEGTRYGDAVRYPIAPHLSSPSRLLNTPSLALASQETARQPCQGKQTFLGSMPCKLQIQSRSTSAERFLGSMPVT